jgi:hypothetical protein
MDSEDRLIRAVFVFPRHHMVVLRLASMIEPSRIERREVPSEDYPNLVAVETYIDGERVYLMEEIEDLLDRKRSTIRTWEGWNSWPRTLNFKRTSQGWRYWTQEQLDEALIWLAERHPGRSRPR